MGQKLKLDFSGVESFQRASEGVHNVKVATAELTQSQGGNDMITVAFEVTKGADKGSRVYENFPLVDSALWKLKGFLQAIGMKADGKVQLDVDKLVGKVCSINVIHEEYEGKIRAKCESIMKLVAEASDEDEDFDDEDQDDEQEEEAEEKKPAKKEKANKKPAKKSEPEDDEDEDDDWDDEDDEEPEEKPKKSKKAEKPAAKKDDKKSKKSKKEESDDDDWDDEDGDDDWDED